MRMEGLIKSCQETMDEKGAQVGCGHLLRNGWKTDMHQMYQLQAALQAQQPSLPVAAV